LTIQFHTDADGAAVAVYLNDSRDSMLGFDPADAQLVLAARFTIPAPSTAEEVAAALEGIFEQLNVGGELIAAFDYTVDYRAAGHRSLSVGDVVTIGETAFAVARFGFDTIPAAVLTAAMNVAAS